MKVVIIPSEEFLPAGNHLAGIFQYHQAQALRSAGISVHVLSIKQSLSLPMLIKAAIFKIFGGMITNELKNDSLYVLWTKCWCKMFNIQALIKEDIISGIHVTRIDGFYYFPPSKHTNHIGWLKAGKAVMRFYISKFGLPDIIHAHNAVYGGLLAKRLNRIYGIPYFITEHSSYLIRGLESGFLSRTIVKAFSNSTKFYVVSRFVGEQVNKVFKSNLKWEVLPNVLDPEVEKQPWTEKSTQNNKITFLNLASFIPIKRQKDLIKAFLTEFADEENVQLVIAGDGPLKNDIECRVAASKQAHKIHILGKLDRPSVIHALDECDVFVLTSEMETFGVVLIEALSRGKMVVATKCGGPESIVTDFNGILCEIGDIDSIRKALRKSFYRFKDFNGATIRNLALENYGSRQLADVLIKDYKSVLN